MIYFFKEDRKAFYKCSTGSKCKEKKLTTVIKVKSKHNFLYQLTSERIKQISEEQCGQMVICAKLQKPQMFTYHT